MTEVMMKNDQVPVTEQTTGLIRMIEQVCINPEMDVNKLERMLDMQERVLDRQAEQSFQIALAEMQSKMPVIQKTGEIRVGKDVRSKFAKFEDINKAVLPIMRDYGFSLTFETQQADQYINVIGVLRHKDGHKESTQLQIPYDNSGSKNPVQAVGSSVSYGKRYVMTALLNLTVADDDDDGVAAVPPVDLFNHNMMVQIHFDTIAEAKRLLANNHIHEAINLIKQDIPEDDQRFLWVAPTKGGIFTTEERAKMKTPSQYRNEEA